MRLRIIVAWVLSVVAILLAVLVVLMAFYMCDPVDWTGPGILGMMALVFSPQLLILTVVGLLLCFLSGRVRARMAETIFMAIAVLSLIMAIAPNVSIWKRSYHVPLSLKMALLPKLNNGGPAPDQSFIYSTSPDGIPLKMDVWKTTVSDSGKPHPAILRIHGGGWIKGTRGQLSLWNKWFNDLGYDVFDIDYRMPPSAHWRYLNEVADVKCAISWVADHATEYHIDTDRISLFGYSAGGNLALLAAYSMEDTTMPPSCAARPLRVQFVINLYGPTDLTSLFDSSGSPAYVQHALRTYVGASPSENPEAYKILSPLRRVKSDLPPAISIIGEKDRIVPPEQVELLDRALNSNGVHHELYLIPWADHAFDVNWNGFPAQIARARIKRFIEQFQH